MCCARWIREHDESERPWEFSWHGTIVGDDAPHPKPRLTSTGIIWLWGWCMGLSQKKWIWVLFPYNCQNQWRSHAYQRESTEEQSTETNGRALEKLGTGLDFLNAIHGNPLLCLQNDLSDFSLFNQFSSSPHLTQFEQKQISECECEWLILAKLPYASSQLELLEKNLSKQRD